jgi:hypothetical protein
VMHLLSILDNLSMVIGNRNLPGHFKRSVLHAFDRNFHLSSSFTVQKFNHWSNPRQFIPGVFHAGPSSDPLHSSRNEE